MKKNVFPNKLGYFGDFGGKFIPETLIEPINSLIENYNKYKKDKKFILEYKDILEKYVGRPTPLTFAKNLTELLGGAKIYLKREDLTHTGAHKINNTIGQCLLAKLMGKTRVIAETGAGQHGYATATAASMFNLDCVIYMGETDMKRQSMNVYRIHLVGGKVIPVNSGSKTLKDAINEAMRDWVTNYHNTHYVLGSVLGPHPYPVMVRHFQSIIGLETKKQILQIEKKMPDLLVACVGGGSNAIGLFYPFINDKNVNMTGVEAGGKGTHTKKHASRIGYGKIGIFHGAKTILLQDKNGQIKNTYSVSAGLDYSAIGPEHANLNATKRIEYTNVKDVEAIKAFHLLCKYEGIIPALESSHALAHVIKIAPSMPKNKIIICNLSGRGDKDIDSIKDFNG